MPPLDGGGRRAAQGGSAAARRMVVADFWGGANLAVRIAHRRQVPRRSRSQSRDASDARAHYTVARRKTLALTVARRKIFTIIRHHRRQALTIMQDPRTNSPTAGDESLTKRRSEGTYLHVVGGRSSPLP